ncbi:hypothetical protein CI610_00248 [invertebrate metagenome]|uniref:DUF11 domain-containing protein n=1 Tax=invertebrate metagenome TaxID=1711999 RepID=A0A2H9TBY7_9ZZZZ
MQFKFLANAIIATGILLGTAHAQAKLLESRMETYQVEAVQGQETLHSITETQPGNILEYRLVYTSHANKPLSIQYISVPVPENTQYMAASAKTAVISTFRVSIDDGKTWETEPVIRQRKDKNGEVKEVTIPASEYTHLRWQEQNAIAPGAQQVFNYRVKVE